jgi:tripeptide aminopeptidase
MNPKRLVERFLRYVTVDTTANADVEDYPSSKGQLVLGRMLVDELREAGLADARQDRFGIVWATVPATIGRDAPTIAWCAHLDTSPETTGAGVKPQIIENYAGGDIVLPGDSRQVIRTSQSPELNALIGRTLITTDGTTLLGADDKAGVAVIMESAVWLMEHPEIPHGPIRLCFTCDEEVGRGVDHIELAELGAVACYTLDGQGADTIDVETFSADMATATIHGINVHPGIAKGRMVNAVRVAADFLGRLPRDNAAPETTADRDGFLHPYQMRGGVAEVVVEILLRDFQTAGLERWAAQLREASQASMAAFPGSKIDLAIVRQYRNMADGLANDPRAVVHAEKSLQRLGRVPKQTIVRGGTDGSRLTEMGLPTPNLSAGQHSPHSPLEWACVEEMLGAVEWLIALAGSWANA